MIENYDCTMRVMFKDNDLRNNLIKDNFFEYSGVIHIIDNYNIFSISDEATEFYVDNFVGTGCSKIIFYMEVQEINYLKKYSELFRIYKKDIIYLFRKLYGRKNKTEDFINDMLNGDFNKVTDKLNPAIKFMEKMNDNGIDVYIKLYKLKQKDLKFHGRYWLSSFDDDCDFKAYMVDGSLNTYPKSLILAQLMDCENKKIFKEYLNKELIIGTNGFGPIGLNDLRALKP